jgi:hypothetical protein
VHVLDPLTEITGKDKIIWTDRQQKAFEAMKARVAEDVFDNKTQRNNNQRLSDGKDMSGV